MAGKAKKTTQLQIPKTSGWGGFRKGAGRKRKSAPSVSHKTRQTFRPNQPIHVTLKFRKGLPSLRVRKFAKVIWNALVLACDLDHVRIVHFSIQKDHIHLVLEAEDKKSLSRAMQGFCIRIAKGINKKFKNRGSVFADRYHAHFLRTPSEVRNALCYVLNNKRRHAKEHGHRYEDGWIDPLSSAIMFDGWVKGMVKISVKGTGPPIQQAKNWLLTTGWRKRGLISPNEIPAKRKWGKGSCNKCL